MEKKCVIHCVTVSETSEILLVWPRNAEKVDLKGGIQSTETSKATKALWVTSRQCKYYDSGC